MFRSQSWQWGVIIFVCYNLFWSEHRPHVWERYSKIFPLIFLPVCWQITGFVQCSLSTIKFLIHLGAFLCDSRVGPASSSSQKRWMLGKYLQLRTAYFESLFCFFSNYASTFWKNVLHKLEGSLNSSLDSTAKNEDFGLKIRLDFLLVKCVDEQSGNALLSYWCNCRSRMSLPHCLMSHVFLSSLHQLNFSLCDHQPCLNLLCFLLIHSNR